MPRSLNDFPEDVQKTIYQLLAKAAVRKAEAKAAAEKPA